MREKLTDAGGGRETCPPNVVDGTTADSLGYVQTLLGTYWWEFDADAYLPVDANDYLQMTGTSASSTPMYRCVDTVL
jgi:hypothetical protein